MNYIQTNENSLNAYELYLLEFDITQKAQNLICQMRLKLEDSNKITLEKLEYVDIMAQQYILQNNYEKQNCCTEHNKVSKIFRYLEQFKKWRY